MSVQALPHHRHHPSDLKFLPTCVHAPSWQASCCGGCKTCLWLRLRAAIGPAMHSCPPGAESHKQLVICRTDACRLWRPQQPTAGAHSVSEPIPSQPELPPSWMTMSPSYTLHTPISSISSSSSRSQMQSPVKLRLPLQMCCRMGTRRMHDCIRGRRLGWT